MQPLLPFPSEINPECPEQCRLRGMSQAERIAEFNSLVNMRGRRLSIGMILVKLDGNLVAAGYEEDIPDMLVQFNEYIDGPDQPFRKGGMG